MRCAMNVCVLQGCSALVPSSVSPALGCYCCLAVGGQRSTCARVADLIGVDICQPTPLQVMALLEDLQEAFFAERIACELCAGGLQADKGCPDAQHLFYRRGQANASIKHRFSAFYFNWQCAGCWSSLRLLRCCQISHFHSQQTLHQTFPEKYLTPLGAQLPLCRCRLWVEDMCLFIFSCSEV